MFRFPLFRIPVTNFCRSLCILVPVCVLLDSCAFRVGGFWPRSVNLLECCLTTVYRVVGISSSPISHPVSAQLILRGIQSSPMSRSTSFVIPRTPQHHHQYVMQPNVIVRLSSNMSNASCLPLPLKRIVGCCSSAHLLRSL